MNTHKNLNNIHLLSKNIPLQATNSLNGLKSFTEKTSPFHIQSGANPISSTCENALVAMYQSTINCTYFQNVTTILQPNSYLTQAQVGAVCATTCKQAIDNATNNLLFSCSGLDASNYQIDNPSFNIRSILLALIVPCITDSSGNYCLPTFTNLANITSNLPNITVAQLSSVCTPCLATFFKAFVEFGNYSAVNAAAATAALCLKDGSTYCYITIINSVASTNSSNLTQLINAICSTRCYVRFLALGVVFAPNATTRAQELTALQSLDSFCVVNANGQNCLAAFATVFVQYIEDLFNGTYGTCNPSSANICPPACKTLAVNDFTNPLGCCLQTLINSHSISLSDSPFSIISNCSITVGSACGTAALVSGKLRIANLAWSYVSPISAQVLQDFYSDLGSYFGTDPSRITGTCNQQSSSSTITPPTTTSSISVSTGTDFTFSFPTDSIAQSTDMQNAFNTDLQSNTIMLPTISNYPIQSRIVPIAGLSIDNTSSTVQTQNTSSSSSSSSSGGSGAYLISPNSLMILMSAIASFMFFYVQE